MPLKVRRFSTSVLLILSGTGAFASAQTQPASTPATQPAAPQQIIPVRTPTSAEVMRDRISKAKAFIAVRNYNAAIYELENIRRETSDASVQAVTNVLLMNSYLEQGDYKKAQDFLAEAYNAQKTSRPNAYDLYNAVAAQVIKGARTKVERYRSLGLAVSDRSLPLEAVNDVERMRETLEVVITQTKDIGKDKTKSSTAMALLEEATNSRGALARDEYDARRWTDEVADSREQMANSNSVITSAVDGTTTSTAVPGSIVAANVSSQPTANPNQPASTSQGVIPTPQTVPAVVKQPAAEQTNKPSDALLAVSDKTVVENKPVAEDRKPANEPLKTQIIQSAPKQVVETPRPEVKPQAGTSAESAAGPMEVGSLIGYATQQSAPIYPAAARSMRTSGVVKVEVTVNESGEVAEVKKTSGPSLLQTAAKDAVRKWKFRPFVRDGQPVKATGFVSFNFSL
jgi:TonB family protein